MCLDRTRVDLILHQGKEKKSSLGDAGAESSTMNSSAAHGFDFTEGAAMQLIEKTHMCASCKRPCFVRDDGTHYVYTTGDIATWAFLLVRNLSDVDM